MLNEIDSFAKPINYLYKNTTSKNKSKIFIIPCSYNNWNRIKIFVSKQKGLSEISDYWDNRIKEFTYFWDYKKELLLITGYFSQFINYKDNTLLNNFNFKNFLELYFERIINKARAVKNGFYDDFGSTKYKKLVKMYFDEYHHLVCEYYPNIVSLINIYEWFKVFDTARIISELDNGNCFTNVLEIGSGSSLLLNTLKKKSLAKRCISIDLPEVIPFGFALSEAVNFDNERISLNENVKDAWLEFQSVGNILVEDSSIDLAINVTSFGEMNTSIVKNYFILIDRVLKPGGLFLCINREKKKVNWSEYSWPVDGYRTILEFEPMISRIGTNRMWQYPIYGIVIQKV